MKRSFARFGVSLLLLLTLAACAPAPAPVVITVVVPATSAPAAAVIITATPANPTAPTTTETTLAPTAGAVPVTADTATPAPTATTGPQCTIKQDVNFRRGPGKVYDPPIDALVTGTVVIPQGYQANGFPGGSWVLVLNPGSNKTGWVSAGADYVTCTVDLTSLPTVEILPTPTPSAPRVSNGQVSGSFTDFPFKLHFSNTTLMRLEVPVGNGKKDGDNIQSVTFSISEGNDTIYTHTENNAPYCIFGGDATCASWPKQDGKYAWSNQGPLVKDGATYNVDIEADGKDGSHGQWLFTLTVNLP